MSYTPMDAVVDYINDHNITEPTEHEIGLCEDYLYEIFADYINELDDIEFDEFVKEINDSLTLFDEYKPE